MHHIDRNAWWDEIWEAMEQLKREGKILYVGSSNFAGWHIARGNEIAGYRHSLGPGHRAVALQPHRAHGRARGDPGGPGVRHGAHPVTARSPAACSPGALKKVSEGRRNEEYMRGEIEANRAQLEPWEALCAELGERPADVALAWLLHQPAVTAPIIGPRTQEQLLGSLRALNVKLTPEILAKLDEIFPGPVDRRPKPTPGSSRAA